MAKRSGQPALYEMMRSPRSLSPSSHAASPHSAGNDFEDDLPPRPEPQPRVIAAISNMLTPGQTIRVPVGYVLLSIGLVLAVMTLSYLVGHKRGEAATETRLKENFGSLTGGGGGVNDPLSLEGGIDPQAGGSGSGGGSTSPQFQTPPVTSGERPTSQWGPVEPQRDPRVKGWTYFVLAQTTPQGAVKIVEFCRANGLETYVVPANNSSRKVIAFPGFQGSSLAPEPKALLQRILTLGTRYKREQPLGGTDFSDAYPSKYDG